MKNHIIPLNGQRTFFFCLIMILFSSAVFAQTYWTGTGGDQDWSNTGNWDTNIVPDASTDVDIPNTGNDPILDASGLTCKNLVIEALASLTGAPACNLTISGNVTGGGTLDAEASTITISGSISVSFFDQITSTIILNGSSLTPQSLNGYEFYNLTINNSNAGIALTGDLTIDNNLTMTQGNIISAGHGITIGTDGSHTGTLTYTAGNFTGTGVLSRWYHAGTSYSLGGASSLYPLGTSTKKRQCWLAGTPTSDGTVSVSYTDDNTVSTFGTPVSEHSQTFTHIHNSHWEYSTANGFTGSGLSIRISAESLPGVSDFSTLDVTGQTGAAPGTYASPTGSNGTPEVNRTGLTDANFPQDFFFAGDVANALPVTLIDFNAVYRDGNVNLSWQTASEINNDHFEIERSLDGIGWQRIGWAKGNGNSQDIKHYFYTDNLDGIVPTGPIYYRLKQIDFNGAFEYSIIRSVNLDPIATEIQAYPNPVTNSLNLSWANTDNSPAVLKLTDLNGRVLFSEDVSGIGLKRREIDMRGCPSGVYFVEVATGKVGLRKKIMKE